MTGSQTPGPESSEDDQGPGMTLSEDELVIDTELVETGRVRLAKRIKVQTVTRTIELRREVLEIERLDPLPASHGDGTSLPDGGTVGGVQSTIQSGALAAGSLEEGIVEIVLMQEEAVITTQTVPRERVHLTKRIVTESRTIDADLSAERADIEQRP